MELEIKKFGNKWRYRISLDKGTSESFDYDSVEDALREGYERLLEHLPKLHDFGQGPVPAHRHKNGGGWVADTAHVSRTVFVGTNACVFGDAHVYDHVQIRDHARVYGRAHLFNHVVIKDRAQIYGTAIIEGIVHIGDNVLFSGIKISGDMEITRT